MSRADPSRSAARHALVSDAIRHRRLGGRLLLLMAVIAVAGLIVLVLGSRPKSAELPVVATNGLDPAIVRVIDAGLQGVCARPRSGDAWGRLASTLHHYDFPAAAQEAYGQAARWSPRDPRWPYLGALLGIERDPAEAITKLRRAVELAPQAPDMPRLRLAQLLAERGQAEAAELEFEQLLKRQPEHAPALLALARLRYQSGRLAEAIPLLDRCLLDPHTQKSARELLATVHRALGNIAQAQDAVRSAATLPQDRPWPDPFWEEASQFNVGLKPALVRASSYLDAGQINEAATLLTATGRAYPGDEEVWYLLGWALNLQQKPREAEEALREHLRLASASAKGYAQLGVSLLAQRRFADAIPILEAGLALKPTWREFHANLGYAAAQLGQMTSAEDHYRRALVCDPSHAPTYRALAELLRRGGRTNEAMEMLHQAGKVSATNP